MQYSNGPAVMLAACDVHAAVAHSGARSAAVIGQLKGSMSCGRRCHSQLDLGWWYGTGKRLGHEPSLRGFGASGDVSSYAIAAAGGIWRSSNASRVAQEGQVRSRRWASQYTVHISECRVADHGV